MNITFKSEEEQLIQEKLKKGMSNTKQLQIAIPKQEIEQFCQRHYIRQLSLFGSVLRDDFTPESDIDFLVEFEPGQTPGYFKIVSMEMELSELLEGRKIDLRTPNELSVYFRDRVMAEAVVQYDSN
jgi:uncharacterized protein